MIEPLFGSSAPNWAAVPSPGFVWLQTAMGSRPAPFGPSGPGSPTNQQGTVGLSGPVLQSSFPGSPYGPLPQPYGFGAGFAAPVQPALGFGAPGPTSGMLSAVSGPYGLQAVTPFTQEFPWGVSASAILTAVAMRRGQPMGPTTDQEVEEFLYDALELLPGTSEVDVRCEGGRAALTGNVQHKRLKHDVGEIAWAIPHISDVQNNVTIATRRRARSAQRENEPVSPAATRKQG